MFRYEDKNVSEELKTEDFETLKNIFADKELYKGKTECGFTDDVSIRINGSQTFCFACDGCVIVYWKEMDMYFELDDEEYEISHGILEKYGFSFPCIFL